MTRSERVLIVPPAMNTQIRLVVCAAALVLASSALQAADAPTPPAKGQVLLLRSERIFEGTVEQVGDQYRVKREGGGETWIRAELVQRLCSSREEAYEYMRTQANLDDPDERLRLAKWCQVNNLREQAIAEIKAAVAMRPEHAESRRLLNSWLEAVLSPASTPHNSSAAVVPRPATAGTTVPHAAATPNIELNAESVGQFIRKVQPILMNTCIRCHAAGRGNPFELTRVTGDGMASRKSSQQNLAAVLAQIKPDQPLASPILVMAASVHGGAAQAPLRNRETPAYRSLEAWVKKTAADSVPLQAKATEPAPTEPVREQQSGVVGPPIPARDQGADAVAQRSPTAPKDDLAPPPPAETKAPDQPVDEFDPLIFNRQMHPEKKDR